VLGVFLPDRVSSVLDFAITGRSPPMPETPEQSDKDDDQFFRLAVNSEA